MKKMMRMYQLDVDINENDEVIISQNRRDGGEPSSVVIPYDQIEALCGVLTKAGEQIEAMRQERDTEDEDDEGPARRTEPVKDPFAVPAKNRH